MMSKIILSYGQSHSCRESHAVDYMSNYFTLKTISYQRSARGIHLSVHWTFILVIIWFVFANVLTGWRANGWIWTGIMVLSLLMSIFLHDMAQATVGVFFGIKITSLVILPVGGLPSLEKRPKKKMHELLMLAAGPAVNLGVAFLLTSFLHPYKAYWNEPENIGFAYPGNFIFQLQFINLSLGLLNLVPAFPMDGGRALDTLLENRFSVSRAKKLTRVISLVIAFGFLFTGVMIAQYVVVLIGLFILFTVRMGQYYHPLGKKTAETRFKNVDLEPVSSE